VRLVAEAVQQQHWRALLEAPFEVVEAQAVGLHEAVARHG
jgi:hypothetical protein